jgi:2-oxo-4-hydroxy-4-carboxy--5-ureidoimidazoline (OHCU) decarboxylase
LNGLGKTEFVDKIGRLFQKGNWIAEAAYHKRPFNSMARAESLRDQRSAGLARLTPEEVESFAGMNKAYRDKFGFPLVVCVRENTKETILASGKERLENSPPQEKAAGLLEIIEIANLRLRDIVEAPLASGATV